MWPVGRAEELLPLYQEEQVLFGLLDGVVLSVAQIRRPQSNPSSEDKSPPADELFGLIGPSWVGGLLWRGGAMLARWADLCAGPFFWRGQRVLEVGAGVGLPSVVAAYHGANVTATDLSPRALRVLHWNHVVTQGGTSKAAKAHTPYTSLQSNSRLSAARLNFRDPQSLRQFRRAHGTFDIIIGAGIGSSRQTVESRIAMWRGLAALLDPCRLAVVVALEESALINELADWARGVLPLAGGKAGSNLQAAFQILSREVAYIDFRGDGERELAVLQRVDYEPLDCKSHEQIEPSGEGRSSSTEVSLPRADCTVDIAGEHFRWSGRRLVM